MKFGIGTFRCDQHREKRRPFAELYREMLDAVQLAERNGFDSAWVTEHHFTEMGYLPSVTTALSAMAAVTETIAIGSNIALGPQYRQPVRLAEDLAVVDNISDGRLRFGVGNGYRRAEFDAFDVPLDQRALRLEHLITILRKAWTEDELVHDGHEVLGPGFEFDGVPVTPKPAQEGGPPIIVGGFAPPAIRRAGRMGDGYTTGSLVGLDEAAEYVDVYWDAVDEAGKDRSEQELVIWNFAYLTDGGNAADDVAAGWQQVLDQYGRWYHNAGLIDDPEDLHAGFDEAALFYDSPETMVAEIERLQDVFGDDIHFVCQMALPGLPYEKLARSIELFGREVIPEFR